MNKGLVHFLFILVVSTSSHAKTEFNIAKLEKDLQALATKYNATASAVAITNRDKTLYVNTFGYTDTSQTQKANSKTLFNVGSQSKMVTALGVMLAVQNKSVELEAPIAQYLPKLSVNSRYDNAPFTKMTLRHLLSNQSGLPKFARVGNIFNPGDATFKEHVMSIKSMWLQYPVGSRYNYSNLNFDLAAFILEKKLRKSFVDYTDNAIFKPLNMTRASFDYQKISDDTNRAKGQVPNTASPDVRIPTMAGGQLYASISDMALFLRLHLNQGTPLLDTQSYKILTTIPKKGKKQLAGYALGCDVIQIAKDITLFKHDGGGYGFTSLAVWSPELNLGVEIMTNAETSPEIVSKVQTLVYGLFEQKLRAEKITTLLDFLPDEKLNTRIKVKEPAFLGNYIYSQSPFNDTSFFVTEKNNKFYLKKNRSKVKSRVMPLSTEQFALKRAFIPEKGLKLLDKKIPFIYRYVPAEKNQAAFLHNLTIDRYYDLNQQTAITVPNRTHWKGFTGIYTLTRYGNPARELQIYVEGGKLYIDSYVLTPSTTKNLFFAANGWAAEFTDEGVYFGGIYMTKNKAITQH